VPYPTGRPRAAGVPPEVAGTLQGKGVKIVRTAYRSPWQNGMAERWVLSVRQVLLNSVASWVSATFADCWPTAFAIATRIGVILGWRRTVR
jgi:hypothetical protein